MLKWLVRIVVGFMAAIALLVASGYAYEAISAARDARRFDPPGEMVDVGGYRLNILCKGDAPAPSVVIEAGGGVGAIGYLAVQDEIARFARVCSYDRAGLGWSDAAAWPHSFAEHARELDALLEGADIPGPYVLVAHSWGGGVAREFARGNPEKVAGLALIETGDQALVALAPAREAFARAKEINSVAAVMHRFGIIRLVPGLLGPYANAPDEVKARLLRPGTFAAMAAEGDVIANTPVDQGWSDSGISLGDTPLVVVIRGRPDMGDDPEFERAWGEANRRIAEVSTNSMVIVAAQSGHMIHVDEPDVFVDAVRRVVATAREGSRVQGAGD